MSCFHLTFTETLIPEELRDATNFTILYTREHERFTILPGNPTILKNRKEWVCSKEHYQNPGFFITFNKEGHYVRCGSALNMSDRIKNLELNDNEAYLDIGIAHHSGKKGYDSMREFKQIFKRNLTSKLNKNIQTENILDNHYC